MTMNWIKKLFGTGTPHTNGASTRTDMISCDDALERLYEFLDAELDEAWRSRVDEHFEACKACLPALQFERRFLDALQSSKAEAATPEGIRNRILAVLAEEGLEPGGR